MTKSQIKAELRRSACEDCSPFLNCLWGAFEEALYWKLEGSGQKMADMKNGDLRTYFLLVAEAL